MNELPPEMRLGQKRETSTLAHLRYDLEKLPNEQDGVVAQRRQRRSGMDYY